MKGTFSGMVLGFVASVVSLTYPSLHAQEPTIEVTGQYLVSKLDGLKGTWVRLHGDSTVYTTSDVSFASCSLSFTKTTEVTTLGKHGGTTSSKTTYRVPMKDVEPGSVKSTESVTHPNDNGFMTLLPGYVTLMVNNLEVNGKTASGTVNLHIATDPKDAYKIPGIVKALQHAVALCGGKKDPFAN